MEPAGTVERDAAHLAISNSAKRFARGNHSQGKTPAASYDGGTGVLAGGGIASPPGCIEMYAQLQAGV